MPQAHKERGLVRELARQVSQIASEPRMEAIRKRWRDVNALRKPDRAPVWCRPVGCWDEILSPSTLVCQDPWLRQLEYSLRQITAKYDIDDDTPVEGYWAIQAVFTVTPANTWGVEVSHRQPETEGGAWAFDPALKTEADFGRLRSPVFTYDAAKTREHVGRTEDLIGDILPVRLVMEAPLGATLGTAADLRGLQQVMIDMIAEPHLVHRLMTWIRDATLQAMDQAQATGLVTPNNTGPMVCSDPIGEAAPDGTYTYRNCWCMANSQEFDQVSPAMWEEFCLNYQKPIFERFGLVGYGCCENLTKKIDGVLSIPNLRILVCSAWTNLGTVIERVGRSCCIMWRQKASDVVFPDDVSRVRHDLLEGARRLQGCFYQVVLRELQTLAGHPDRLHVWTALAKEAATRYA